MLGWWHVDKEAAMNSALDGRDSAFTNVGDHLLKIISDRPYGVRIAASMSLCTNG